MSCIFLAVCALPLRVDIPETGVGAGKTYVEIRETKEPGAVRRVEFQNAPINGNRDNRTYALEWGGTVTQVRFQWNAGAGGADGIEIIPPAGYSCLPECWAIIGEGDSTVIYIFPAMS